MAGPASTTSSMTSTSHTLTNAPSLSFLSTLTDSKRPSSGMEMLALFEAIKAGNRHDFLQPTVSLPNASLQLAKATLDSYASQVSDEQQQRQREAKKRKRAEQGYSPTEVLKVRKLHVEGFESNQVWQQAKRIITCTLQDAKQTLKELEERNQVQKEDVNGEEDLSELDESEIYGSELSDEDSVSESDEEKDGEELEDELSDDEAGDDNDHLEEMVEGDIEEEDDDDEGEDEDEVDDQNNEESEEEDVGSFVADPHGLNDGFFSIDEFNKQTQMFEDADARADPNVDQGSEDEEIDWHADLLSTKQPAVKINPKMSKKNKKENDDDMAFGFENEDEDEGEDDEDDEGGPTFGNMDLDAPEGDSEIEDEDGAMDDEDEFNANDIHYKDFFAPPRRKGGNKSKPRKSDTTKLMGPAEDEVERAMADVRRDLFDDESEREDSEDALSELSAGDPRSRRSAFERRQAKLAEEIRKLEAANVAKKDWTMAGEAVAADRPVNSLLEQDLDFEHAGKPVPVITPDINESIEDLIKRRIIAREFDEVIRRRPDAAEFSSSTRRGLATVEDTKSKQSLAEIYEEEHVKNANPDSYVSKSEEKQRKEEKEIEQMWKELSSKLDALSSWHYRPKPVSATLTIMPDVATISMEDAQPTTAQGVSGGDNTLAPQEVYKAGKDTAEKGEVVTKNGLPVAKQEMTREDKIRRRRREKERIRKAGGNDGNKPQSTKASQRQATLGDLRKGGVRVINKKGEVVDIDGNKAKAARAASSGAFKL